jgi:TPR repeat protein
MKLYRRLASKTQHETQITYAHYLLQIANLYSSPNPTRTRLLKEAGYWINRLSNKNHPEAVYQEGLWHLHGSDVPGYESIKINKAKKNFQKASKKGYLDAHYQLAQLLEPSKKVIKLYDKGVKENHTPSVIVSLSILVY